MFYIDETTNSNNSPMIVFIFSYFQSYHLDVSCIQIASALKFTRDNKNYKKDEEDLEIVDPEDNNDQISNDEDDDGNYEEVITITSKVVGL